MSTPVVALAMQHAAAFERRQRRAGMFERLSRVQAWVSLRWSRVTLAGMLRRDAAFLADQALWHRGAAVSVDRAERVAPLDPDFVIIERLRGIETRLLALRMRVLDKHKDLRNHAGSTSAKVLALTSAEWSAAAADCYEAMRELRGALQAYEADRSAMGRAARSASTAEELDAQLDEAARRQ